MTNLYRVTHNGKELFKGTDDDCFLFLHQRHPGRVYHAINSEGYKVEKIEGCKEANDSCPVCGSQDVEWIVGFPGERLLICSDCGEAVDSELDEQDAV